MARTRTLAELRTEALQLADMEDVTSYIDTSVDGEVDRYINQGIAELYDLLIASAGEEWYLLTDTTITTVADTDTYDLPEQFYLLRGVDYVQGDVSIPLSPYNFANRHQDTSAALLGRGRLARGRPYQYRLCGILAESPAVFGTYTPQIRFTPMPKDAHNIRLWYFPHAPELDDDTYVWDGFNGWEEYVTVFAAIKLRAKEESDYTDLMLRKQELTARIQDLGANRDLGAQEKIADVEGGYPDASNWRWW